MSVLGTERREVGHGIEREWERLWGGGGRLQRQDVARLYRTMAVRVRNLNVILV